MLFVTGFEPGQRDANYTTKETLLLAADSFVPPMN